MLAADQPTADVPDVGPVDTLVARALAEREELKRGTNVIAQRSIEAEAAENDRLPALDVVAGAGLTVPDGNRPTAASSQNAPAATSCAGTSWPRSQSTTLGLWRSTTPRMTPT